MKRFFVAIAAVLFCVGFAFTQTSHDDGGVLVVEDSLLSPAHKQVVFVIATNIVQSTKIEVEVHTLDGIYNRFKPLQFPQGVRRGQIIPIWNGEFNQFHDTPWLYIWVIMSTATDNYYTNTMFPVNNGEQYKEPLIVSVDETGGYNTPYVITAKGIFDTPIPSLILINSSLFVSPKVITQTAPGIIRFTMGARTTGQFPPGKYLLTICQGSHCDTLVGRHR